MCGRYALSLRPSQVRQRLISQGMPTNDAPPDEDDQVRQSYNFAPGYHGLIYRADTSDHGAGDQAPDTQTNHNDEAGEPMPKKAKTSNDAPSQTIDGLATQKTKFKLQAAKWGLVPFWTKRPPDYGSQMRTINCRDDSLIENRGMWNTMKQRKRCIVVAEGFYEWLKKNNGKEKIPHFVKRKDGELMCFAGLWDVVQYEGSEEKLYTYTIITTDSNKQLTFLHDRMPVILEAGSEQMKTWLDQGKVGWSKELQSMLKPFNRELECYPVDKAVGKVGNNSPQFLVPINSKENKNNIANFFGSQQSKAKTKEEQVEAKEKEEDVQQDHVKVKQEAGEHRQTDSNIEGTEDNAPVPKPPGKPEKDLSQEIKQEASTFDDQALSDAADEMTERSIKQEASTVDDKALTDAADEMTERGIKRKASALDDESFIKVASSPVKSNKPSTATLSPIKKSTASDRQMRSSTTNNTAAKTPTKEGNARITNFFRK